MTVEQFLRFRKGHEYIKQHSPTDDCPVQGVSWYDAAAYCNWLSEREGMPKEHWCYEPNAKGEYEEGMKLAPDYLQRTGYRLPTEAEWEFGCRAGADSAYSFGESADLLEKYAWFNQNSFSINHPVGSLKPNDLGMFDMHGNVWQWCQERYLNSPKGQGITDDKEDILTIATEVGRVLRGGSFRDPASKVRSAYRSNYGPVYRLNSYGFRPARTLPLVPFTALPLPPEGGEK